MTIYTAALYIFVTNHWTPYKLGILDIPHGKEKDCETFVISPTKYKKFCREEVSSEKVAVK